MLADWFHNTSEVIISGLASPTGYNNNIASPGANSALFNGHGVFDCSLTEPSGRCHNVSRPEIFLRPDVRTRLRWIGGSTHAMIRASIDEHPLSIIEADGTGVKGRMWPLAFEGTCADLLRSRAPSRVRLRRPEVQHRRHYHRGGRRTELLDARRHGHDLLGLQHDRCDADISLRCRMLKTRQALPPDSLPSASSTPTGRHRRGRRPRKIGPTSASPASASTRTE